MESCALLWNGTSEEESTYGNHWKRWGEMFAIINFNSHQFIIIINGKKIHCEQIDATKQLSLRIKQCMLFPGLRAILILFYISAEWEEQEKKIVRYIK